MGQVHVYVNGSFGNREHLSEARTRGHAHAVADAIRYLAEVELPRAIAQDHDLHEHGAHPEHGFDREE